MQNKKDAYDLDEVDVFWIVFYALLAGVTLIYGFSWIYSYLVSVWAYEVLAED